MNRVVFLLEERSMKTLLDGLLPRLFPKLPYLCVTHEGKQDLEKSIPRKLRAWREPGVRFVVVCDNDRGDCRTLKSRLVELTAESGRADTLVRIACQELEAWYLGDPFGLALEFGQASLGRIGEKARFRDPDRVDTPARVLRDLIPEFQKVSGARRMGTVLSQENSSRSYAVFLSALRRLAEEFSSQDS